MATGAHRLSFDQTESGIGKSDVSDRHPSHAFACCRPGVPASGQFFAYRKHYPSHNAETTDFYAVHSRKRMPALPPMAAAPAVGSGDTHPPRGRLACVRCRGVGASVQPREAWARATDSGRAIAGAGASVPPGFFGYRVLCARWASWPLVRAPFG